MSDTPEPGKVAQSMPNPDDIPWLIWSNEKGKWWRPGQAGYTPIIAEEGRYSRRIADQIVRESNYGPFVHEVAVPAPEAFA